MRGYDLYSILINLSHLVVQRNGGAINPVLRERIEIDVSETTTCSMLITPSAAMRQARHNTSLPSFLVLTAFWLSSLWRRLTTKYGKQSATKRSGSANL